MTTEELQELDVFCAEFVMGWKRVSSLIAVVEGTFAVHPGEGVVYVHVQGRHITRFCPTNGGYDAMQLLEKCCEEIESKAFETDCVQIQKHDGLWHVATFEKVTPVCSAETLPLAICLFAKEILKK